VLTAWVFLLAAATTGRDPDAWLEVVRESGTESCPDARELGGVVEGELGRALPRRRVRCVVAREGRVWRAHIAIDGEGQREDTLRTIRIQGASCRPLASALELTLTLALAAVPAAAQELPVPQVTDDERPEGLAAHPARAGAPGPWGASAGAMVSAGALLEVSTGLELGGRWRRGRFLVAVDARGERALPVHQGPATLEGWRTSAALLPCFAPGSIRLCGVARAGGFTVHSEGLAVSRSRWGVLAEAGARAVWQLGGDGLALAPFLEITAPLVRTRLLVDEQPSWSSPPMIFSFGLAVVMGR
jgi:hypothetical protein